MPSAALASGVLAAVSLLVGWILAVADPALPSMIFVGVGGGAAIVALVAGGLARREKKGIAGIVLGFVGLGAVAAIVIVLKAPSDSGGGSPKGMPTTTPS